MRFFFVVRILLAVSAFPLAAVACEDLVAPKLVADTPDCGRSVTLRQGAEVADCRKHGAL